MKVYLSIVLLSASATADEPTTDCPMHARHMAEAATHAEGVETRGDVAMGFPHDATVHSFKLTTTGGFIAVRARPGDNATTNAIRDHLARIAQAFALGNFSIPRQVHGVVLPGTQEMKRRRAAINYRFEQTADGGQVTIETSDPKALRAVHDFLRFQIADHHTGDSPSVEGTR